MTASGQFLVEIVEHEVAQKGREYSLNAKGNFRFEPEIGGWRGGSVGIPCRTAPSETPSGEPVTVRKAAEVLNLASGTVLRWIEAGFIPAEQPTPGAPWEIRITDDLLSRFVENTPPGFIPTIEATKQLGVSRQTILQRVKRGELQAVHIRQGRRKGLRIKVPDAKGDLFAVSPGIGG